MHELRQAGESHGQIDFVGKGEPMGEENATQAQKPKKRSGCLKKTILLCIAIGVVGAVSHQIRYSTNPDYARQYDAEQAGQKADREASAVRRKEEAARRDEEIQIADAKKKEQEAAEQSKKSVPKMDPEVRKFVQSALGRDHFLLGSKNPYYNYDYDELTENIAALYFSDMDDNRVTVFELTLPFGRGLHHEVFWGGTKDDPRWKIFFDNSNFEMMNILLDSGSLRIQVFYNYQHRLSEINLVQQ